MNPVAVLMHVDDINESVRWYLAAFPSADLMESTDEVKILSVQGFQIEIVRGDDKVSSGKAGTVLYWSVDDLDDVIVRLEWLGAKLYRGPLLVEDGIKKDGFRMCQLEDPFGNLIGFRGR